MKQSISPLERVWGDKARICIGESMRKTNRPKAWHMADGVGMDHGACPHLAESRRPEHPLNTARVWLAFLLLAASCQLPAVSCPTPMNCGLVFDLKPTYPLILL